jgi:hypothetical protein
VRRRALLTYPNPRNKPHDNILHDIDTPSLQRAANDRKHGPDKNRPPPTKPIGRFGTGQRSQQPTRLKEPIDGPLQIRGIASRVQCEIAYEGRLGQGRGDDTCAIAVSEATQSYEEDELGIRFTSVMYL